ncbi:MAG: tRNA-dihydrouridine synthase [Candidatus Nomurabacteria bacterium]|jgi:tRNA-dihydrouridine synthase|nr:tRNA-dihydrouridine synthase [Candidatus Nomurabacteria bacterium]
MTIWEELTSKKPFFALAPMEDVTDTAFRQVILRAARPDVFFTEFMNVNGFCHPAGRTNVARRLKYQPSEQPIIAQVWGSDPEKFTETATELAKMGFAGIDINMGCPDKAVVRAGGGSALIKNPALAADIIAAIKASCSQPISVKTRLGYSSIDEWQAWPSHLLQQDLACLTVHLRTKKEMSKVPAHHELIPEIIKLRDELAPETKLVINGDIADRAAGNELAHKHPGIDGIMIGRGVFANPFCFEQTPQHHSREELIDLLVYHLDKFDEEKCRAASPKFDPLKRFFKIYINNFPGASDLRAKLMQAKNTTEVRDILDTWINQK